MRIPTIGNYWGVLVLRFLAFGSLLEGVRGVMTHPSELRLTLAASATAMCWTLADKEAAAAFERKAKTSNTFLPPTRAVDQRKIE